MATRLNKKVLVITVLSISVVVGGLGMAWFYTAYRSASRNISQGDALLAEGRPNEARKQYGRAVRKEPANLQHLVKLREALLQVVPVTPDEAMAYFDEYLMTLRHEARYNPTSAAAHMQMIEALYAASRVTGLDGYWERLRGAADTMVNRVPESDPRWYEGLLYRGLATLRTEDSKLTETFDDDGNIQFPGEVDLVRVLEFDPGSDLAWAALAHGRMAVYYRLDNEGRTHQAQKNRQLAQRTMTRAVEASRGGLEVSIANLREAMLAVIRLHRQEDFRPGSVEQAEFDRVEDRVQGAVVSMLDAYDPTRDSLRTREMVSLLVGSRGTGTERAIEVLRTHLAANPSDLGHRFVLAGLLEVKGLLDESDAEARAVVDSSQFTVGIAAIEQYQLRPLSAKLLFVVEHARLRQMDRTLVDGDYSELAARRAVLLDLVSGDEEHMFILECDGRAAMLREDWALGATYFEKLIEKVPTAPAIVQRMAARCLVASGATGLARDRLAMAVRLEPESLANYILKARIEFSMSRFDEATATLATLPESVRTSNPDVISLLDSLARVSGGPTAILMSPVSQVLLLAERALSLDDPDRAKEIIQSAIDEQEEPNWRLLMGMASLSLQVGDRDEASRWIDAAIEVDPQNQRLRELKAVASSDNEIDAMITYVRAYVDEEEQASTLTMMLHRMANKLQQDARRLERVGRDEQAAAMRQRAEDAAEASARFRAMLDDGDTSITTSLILRFEEAVSSGDFDAAEAMLPEIERENPDMAGGKTAHALLDLARAQRARDAGDDAESTRLLDRANLSAKAITDRVPFDSTGWRLLGRVQEQLGDYDQMLAAYAEAYRLSPTNIENVRYYIRAMRIAGEDPQRQLRILRVAKDEFATDSLVTEAWLEMEMLHGDRSTVLMRRLVRYTIRPEDRDNALKLAFLLVTTEPDRSMVLDTTGKEVFSPREWARMTSAEQETAVAQARDDWDTVIDQILDASAIDGDPDLETAILRASVERDRGDLDGASEVLDAYLEQIRGAPAYPESVITCSGFLFRAQRSQQALSLLQAAVSSQSEMREIDAAIGTLYFRLGQSDKAIEPLGAAAKASDDPATHARWAEALARAGRYDEAQAAIDTLPGTNVEYSRAMLRALVARGRTEALMAQGLQRQAQDELARYRASLNEAMEADPANAVPYMLLARSLLNEYEVTQDRAMLADALQTIEDGMVGNQDSEQLAVVRADVLQADGQLRRAIDEMATFLVSAPGSAAMRQRLVDAHLDSGDEDRAIAVVREGIFFEPTVSTWHERLGDLHRRASDDRESATNAYLDALRLDPSVRVLAKLDETTRTLDPWPYRAVLKAVTGRITQLHPVSELIAAKALHGIGLERQARTKLDAAYSRYREAIDRGWISRGSMMDWYADLQVIFSENAEAGEALARETAGAGLDVQDLAGLALYWKTFGEEHVDHAIALIDEAMEMEVDDNDRHGLLLSRGAYLVEADRFDEAAVVFTQLVDEVPEDALVQNNLAYVVGVYLNRPDEGLPIALAAARQMPRHPSIVDTVATLYERLGRSEEAADTLQFLVQIDPTNAAALARLALLYAGPLGDAQRAIPIAERARSQRPRSPQVLDALGWSYYQAGRQAEGEEFLNQSVKRSPTASAHIHLAQVLKDRELMEQALGQLRIAEELADDSHSRNRIQRLEDDIRKAQASAGS